jgi:DNA-binding LacI/PurR family transcriptional regulator
LNYTIKHIAEYAGVSKSTVSRVISGKGYVSPETREKVLAAIERLHYKPNAVARAMVSRYTRNIGVIIYRQHHPIASHPFYGKILDAILETATNFGYAIFVMTDKEISSRSADYLLEKRVDGLILISRLNDELIDYFKGFGIPFVMVNGSTEDRDVIHIVNDDLTGGMLAAEHLLSLGHRQIGVIAGPQEHRSHSLRLKGFRKKILESGYGHCEIDVCYATTSQYEEGYKAVQVMWERSHKPTAIFATNDMMALGAIRALAEKGWRVPENVAVMGFDDIDFAPISNPSLTTVHSAKSKMGQAAVRMLDELIHGQTHLPKIVQFSPELIVRESTEIRNSKMEGMS